MAREEASEEFESIDAETEDEGQEASSREDGTDPSSQLNTSSKKGKKKKKKRKKKGGVAANSDAQATPAQPSAATKQEQDARFATALEQLQRNSPDSMWLRLDGCNIYDAKTRKIAEALKRNKQITSLDLSDNHIGDMGAGALADALQQGAAPELIFLDLRENRFGSSSTAQLEGILERRRKLSIRFGPFGGVSEPSEPIKSHWDDLEPDPDSENTPPSPWVGGPPPSNGFLEEYFQVGNGIEHALESSSDEADGPQEDPEEQSQLLWNEVEEVLAQKGGWSISALSAVLQQCLAGLVGEMSTCAAPLLSHTKLPELRPFTRRAVHCLPKLAEVLLVRSSTPHLTPFSKEDPVVGVGSHRVTVAQIVERLSFARLAAINTHLVRAGLLPRLFALGFACPHNSILQAACCGILRWSLASGLFLLWKPLLEPGMGLGGQEGFPEDANLASRAISVADAAGQPIARRSCDVGFAVQLALHLRDAASSDSRLQQALHASEGWDDFSRVGGRLDALLAERQGELCGPRPSRPRLLPTLDSATVRSLPGGSASLSSSSSDHLGGGSDLVKLLTQSVHGLHMADDDEDDDDESEEEEELDKVEVGGDGEEEGGGEEALLESGEPDALQRLIDAPLNT